MTISTAAPPARDAAIVIVPPCGQKLISGVNSVEAVFYGESAASGQQPTAKEAFSSYGPGTLLFDSSGNPLPARSPRASPTSPRATGRSPPSQAIPPASSAPRPPRPTAAVAALMMQADSALESDPSEVTQLLNQSAIPSTDSDQSGAGLIHADAAVEAVLAVCFGAGTLIRANAGGIERDVAVERLAVGDLVVTASGERRVIRWLGHRRLDRARHSQPEAVWPVRIVANAFGPSRPARDLVVSPGHALCFDLCGEALVPAGCLANGVSVLQDEVDTVTYWHVELDGHDVILAKNMLAESYIDCGNRSFFAEHGVVAFAAAPDAPHSTTADYCRPFHAGGAVVECLRERLLRRAEAAGWRLADDDPWAGLHLLADGKRIDPEVAGLVARFTLPVGAHDLLLVSKTARPCDVGCGPDTRVLGVRVCALAVVDQTGAANSTALGSVSLGEGWHAVESTAGK